jgi:hypothetical protein
LLVDSHAISTGIWLGITMGDAHSSTKFCEESAAVMKTTATKNNDNSKDRGTPNRINNRFSGIEIAFGTDQTLSKLTTTEAKWISDVRTEGISLIYRQGEDISWHDAAEIFSGQVESLSRNGFQSLYSEKTRIAINGGLVLTDEDNLAILKNRLKNRVKDFFRGRRRIKSGYVASVCSCDDDRCECKCRDAGYSRIVEISEFLWNQIPDPQSELEDERSKARDRLNEIKSQVWEHLNPTDRAILGAALSRPEGLFNRVSLFDAMSEEERHLFLNGKRIRTGAERDIILAAIAARTADVARKVRRILIKTSPGRLGFSDA